MNLCEADGDGSGVAAVIELARVLFAAHRAQLYAPVHSVLFVLFDASTVNQ